MNRFRRPIRCTASAFTLVELLVVVAIIGILAAMALPKLFGALCLSKQGQVKQTVGSLNGALGMYFGKNGSQFPTYSGDASAVVPVEDMNVPLTPWNGTYRYVGTGEDYTICASIASSVGCDGTTNTGDENLYFLYSTGKFSTSNAACP